MNAPLKKEQRIPVKPAGVGDAGAAVVTRSAGSGEDQRVLFISHYSGRNGAPLVLLRLLQWLKANTSLKLHVLVGDRGELIGEFEAAGTVIPSPRLPRIPSAILRRFVGQSGLDAIEDAILRNHVRRLNPALIYSNTITNTREVKALGLLGIPLLCHAHEMEYWIRNELGLEKAKAIVPLIRRFVAVGTGVKDFLVSGVGAAPDSIEVIYAFSDSPIPADIKELRAAARQEFGVDEKTFLVGACGTIDWRKGADLFLAVARRVREDARGRHFRFVWVGGPVSGDFYSQLQHDIARTGLSELVSFAGPCASPTKYYAAMDAFLLPSREDPCPLVMLEAAAFELPIVCFDGSGGAPGFVAEDAGIAVPYLDTGEMAKALIELQGSPELRSRLGGVAKKRMRQRHDPDTQCAAIFDAMIRTQPSLAGAVIS
jgi:glycosyltransferase involved in cell wall biosynthesis